MSPEPIIAPIQQSEPAVETTRAGVECPTPSQDQEQLADNVFSREQTQLAAVVMGLHTGLALTHHLIVETFGTAREEEKPPRRRPEPAERPTR